MQQGFTDERLTDFIHQLIGYCAYFALFMLVLPSNLIMTLHQNLQYVSALLLCLAQGSFSMTVLCPCEKFERICTISSFSINNSVITSNSRWQKHCPRRCICHDTSSFFYRLVIAITVLVVQMKKNLSYQKNNLLNEILRNNFLVSRPSQKTLHLLHSLL